MKQGFPKVIQNDNGIRPAGPDNACFYCSSVLGEEHKLDCVIVEKTVEIEYTTIIPVQVPHSLNESDINFRYNESAWCGDNLSDLIEEAAEKAEKENMPCLCFVTKAKYIRTLDETPFRKIKEP